MYAQLHNTVRSQRERPLLSRRDISGNDMSKFYGQLLDYFDNNLSKQVSIGDTAVQFYMLNHGIALLDGSVSADSALTESQAALYNAYHDHVGKIGVRMVYDIVFMLTAMASTTHPDSYQLDAVEDSYGPQAKAFIEGLVAQTGNVSFWTPNYSQLKPVMQKAWQASGGVKLGDAVRSLGYILDVRQKELSYGPLWRDIARMASSFFDGSKSLETTIDTAFTFCHCNGSFFEKGRLFTAVGNDLFKVLDVQRSGQVPQLVQEARNSLTTHGKTVSLHKQFSLHFPDVFKAKVDWSIVKEVTRNQLVFTSKYKQHWQGMGGAGQAQHNIPPPPKIFSPIDEDSYLNITKGL